MFKILEPLIKTAHLKLGNWRLWSACKKPHKQITSVHNRISIAKGLWASCSNFSKWWEWRSFILENPEPIPVTVIQVIDFHMLCVGCPHICFTGEYIHFQSCYGEKYLHWIKYLVIIRNEQMWRNCLSLHCPKWWPLTTLSYLNLEKLKLNTTRILVPRHISSAQCD